jgi:hypothetical protein
VPSRRREHKLQGIAYIVQDRSIGWVGMLAEALKPVK